MTRIRTVIVDDDPDMRAALAELLTTDPRITVVGMAGDTASALSVAAVQQPDVVLMDVKMPGGGGAQATRLIRRCKPHTQVVALSAYQDRPTILEMFTAGAVGYVVKGSPPAEVLDAVHRAAEGLAVLSPDASVDLVQELGSSLRAEEAHLATRVRRVERIRAAIADGVRMVFQPIVDLDTGRVAGVEALARFRGYPVRAPDVWFADAAGLSLRHDLEHAAVDAALRALPYLPPHLYLSVNMSPQAVVETSFWEHVPPDDVARLVIEVTEHAPVDDYDNLRTVLRPLRERGARFAVDDAGAGFASLRHILLLAPDLIKIDARLTQDAHSHRAQRALASALILFAHETDAVVVAEGIEHADDLEAVRALGADFGQGYLLGAPANLDDLDLTSARAQRLKDFSSVEVPSH